MNNEIARYTFHISSDKRSSGSNSDMNLLIKNTISLKSANSSFYLAVHAVNIPFSFYQVSSDINTLSCVFTDSLGRTKTVNIQISIGNYTCVTVLNELSYQLIEMAKISSGLYVGYTPELTFTYSTQTAKSTFQMTTPALSSIRMNFSSNVVLGTFFGLSTDITISPILTANSTKVAVCNPVNVLFVRSGNMKQTYNREFVIETDVYSDILYRVPVSSSQNTWLQHVSPTEPVQISNNLITDINLYLTTNLTYNPIDLQGVPWAISFSIMEIENIAFTSLTTQLLANLPPPQQPQMSIEEVKKLEQDYQDNLVKLEEYKQRLESKQLKK